jgi:transposase-like protein
MIPKLFDVIQYFDNEDRCIEFLQSHSVFYEHDSCLSCGGRIVLKNKIYRCTTKNCRKKVSLLHNSFFAGSKLRCCEMLYIGYLWLCGASQSVIRLTTGFSNPTITHFMKYYRELVSRALYDDDALVGGDGIIVEVDESKFGKRKYNRGHHVDGAWVVGGVERTSERNVFVEIVEDRSSETLLGVLSRHVRPGSVVYSDMWRGYSRVSSDTTDGGLGFEHMTVNHSEGFINEQTGVHTNFIEGTWNGIKMKVPARNRVRDGMNEHLLEFIWRRKNSQALWNGLLRALKDVHYE